MQVPLFDQATLDGDDLSRDAPEIDPYEGVRLAGKRLAREFEIGEARATDMVLSFGSENAARRALVQKVVLGEERARAA